MEYKWRNSDEVDPLEDLKVEDLKAIETWISAYTRIPEKHNRKFQSMLKLTTPSCDLEIGKLDKEAKLRCVGKHNKQIIVRRTVTLSKDAIIEMIITLIELYEWKVEQEEEDE